MRRKTSHASSSATPTNHCVPLNAEGSTSNRFQDPHQSTLTISPFANIYVHEGSPAVSTCASYSHASLFNTLHTHSRIERMRLWRHDALVQHQHETAVYIGDKILALTNDPNDAFWLAQVYYHTGHYARARGLLMNRYLLDSSVACRYLAALCLSKLSKWQEALDLLGEQNPFHKEDSSELPIKNQDGGIKFEASMCYLRGVLYANLNKFDKAKKCYKEALIIDAKCYEAFEQLISNNLMTAEEEWSFIQTLNFDGLIEEDVDFVKSLYTTKLNKYKNATLFIEAETKLKNIYNLHENTDLLLSRAELLFVQNRFRQCLEVTEKILSIDQYKFNTLPIHLACLHELNEKNKLFLISHDMTERHPEEPVSWLSVGIYYLCIGKVAEARRYFSKASIMNPHFGPAWIGFAHSFAVEGEHDQAISAYTTAARLFQGTHLPSLFLGMQHLQLNNLVLANEYFNTAYDLCKTDPLLLNELGVVAFHKLQLPEAINLFRSALTLAKETDSEERSWIATWANLGHAYRKLRMYDDALKYFSEVKRLSPRDPCVYAAIAMVHLSAHRPGDAVQHLHEALSLAPSDPIATDLLRRALEENAQFPFEIGVTIQDISSDDDNILAD